MLLPHFDRPLSRPPEGHFRINQNSPHAVGLVGWWPMLADRGGDSIKSYIGVNDGAFNGTGWVALPGRGYAVDFPDTSDYVKMPDPASALHNASKFTISIWALTDTLTGGDANLRQLISPASEQAVITRLDTSTDKLQFYARRGSPGFQGMGPAESQVLVADTIYHFSFVWDQGLSSQRLKLYTNGILDGTADASDFPTDNSEQDLYLGSHTGTQRFWSGQMSDLRIYSDAKDAAFAWSLYAPETRWDLYLPVQRIWPAIAAAAANAPTGHIQGPLYGPLGGPIAA